MANLHDFTLPALDGTDVPLKQFDGKVCLVVNVASKCGLTPQYKGLQTLHESYGAKGLAVLGFPCNQFKGQEPGSADEIQSFCTENYGVSFPMFSKIEVNGKGAHPLYQWLTQEDTSPEGPGDVQWNFGKFLIGKDGSVLARFEPTTEPDDPALVAVIEAAL